MKKNSKNPPPGNRDYMVNGLCADVGGGEPIGSIMVMVGVCSQ